MTHAAIARKQYMKKMISEVADVVSIIIMHGAHNDKRSNDYDTFSDDSLYINFDK